MTSVAFKIVGAHGAGQDRAAVIEAGDARVIVLADGAGGVGGGERAAEAVLADVTAALSEGISTNTVRPWIARLLKLDRQLQGIGETTAIVAIVQPGRVLGVSAGDSDLWLTNLPGGLPPRRLTERQQKTRLGTGVASIKPFDEFCRTGTLVAGSDGLWNHLPVDRVQELVVASPPEQAVHGLVEAVRLPSGALRDDVSVIVARLDQSSGVSSSRT